MHWNACGNRRPGLLLLPVVLLLGCRADQKRAGPAQTIVVRDALRSADAREYDSGERAPDRIEVIVAEPRDGAGRSGASPLSALVGRSVRVQFRRDALGLAAPAPVPPTGQGPGGRAVSVSGVVRSATGGWLVLEGDKGRYYVSLTSVLMIEQTDSPTTSRTE
jgi:hypothetical protein